jgi:CheY-like chemotaxis protein
MHPALSKQTATAANHNARIRNMHSMVCEMQTAGANGGASSRGVRPRRWLAGCNAHAEEVRVAPDYDPFDGWNDEPTDRFAAATPTRVLVAEDDPQLRTMMANRLRDDGCEVVEAANGSDAIDKLDESEDRGAALDLVVMDVRMPGASGIEVSYLIRSWRWTMPILLVTAYPEREIIDEAARLGAQVIAKPFALAKLSEAALFAVRRGTR